MLSKIESLIFLLSARINRRSPPYDSQQEAINAGLTTAAASFLGEKYSPPPNGSNVGEIRPEKGFLIVPHHNNRQDAIDDGAIRDAEAFLNDDYSPPPNASNVGEIRPEGGFLIVPKNGESPR